MVKKEAFSYVLRAKVWSYASTASSQEITDLDSTSPGLVGSVGGLDTTLVARVREALVALIKLLKKPPFGASETKMDCYQLLLMALHVYLLRPCDGEMIKRCKKKV